jgi:hypothetical protein
MPTEIEGLRSKIELLSKINTRLLDACRLALNAFENNWAIDWSELELAIKEAQDANRD